jgi:hypothetical protein
MIPFAFALKFAQILHTLEVVAVARNVHPAQGPMPWAIVSVLRSGGGVVVVAARAL